VCGVSGAMGLLTSCTKKASLIALDAASRASRSLCKKTRADDFAVATSEEGEEGKALLRFNLIDIATKTRLKQAVIVQCMKTGANNTLPIAQLSKAVRGN